MVFFRGQNSFPDILVLKPSLHEITLRTLIVLLIMAAGVLTAWFVERQRAAADSLRASERRYQSLFANIEERHFIYAHDVNGLFTYLSPRSPPSSVIRPRSSRHIIPPT